MKRLALLALLLATPVSAQTPEQRLDKIIAAAESILTEARALHIHPEPVPSGWVLSPTPTGKPDIASAFDPQLGLQRSWGTGAIPKSAKPDVAGQFRMTCGAGDLAYIDPIVYPGTVGVSHLHQFYGLLAVRPDETYETARAAGRRSTCGTEANSLNRSGYWLPALLLGNQVIQPNLVSIYYKRRPKTDPKCNWATDPKGEAEECVNMPQGLKIVAGFNMLAPPTTNVNTPGVSFYCGSIKADNLEDVLPSCTGNTKLNVVMDFPNCWDGKHLDSPDHRSHMARGSYGSWGYLKCPATHPKLIPTLHVAAEYSIAATDNRSLLRLASDIFPGLKRGKSLHGDALFAWDPVAHRAFHDNCIDKLLNCSGGDLGNGQQLRGAAQPSYGWTNPVRLVPVPVNGGT